MNTTVTVFTADHAILDAAEAEGLDMALVSIEEGVYAVRYPVAGPVAPVAVDFPRFDAAEAFFVDDDTVGA